jgi:hypothetical protein
MLLVFVIKKKETHNKANPSRALVTQERPRFPGWPEWSNKTVRWSPSVLCRHRASARIKMGTGHAQSRRRQRFSIARDF